MAGAANGAQVRRWFHEKKAGWYAVLADPQMPVISLMVKIFERVFPPVFIFLLSRTGVHPKGLQGLTDYSD